MGDKQHDTKQTHGQTESKDWTQGQGSQDKGQGQYRGQGQPMNSGQNDWNDRSQREMQQGDETRRAEPDGTTPLDKDQQPANQNRPVQQNR